MQSAAENRIGVSDAQIAVRAYERWVGRGRPIGDGAEDWFAARNELEAELGARPVGHVVRGKSSKKASRSARRV